MSVCYIRFDCFAGFSRFWGESSRPNRESTACLQFSSESASDYCPRFITTTSHPANYISKSRASIYPLQNATDNKQNRVNPPFIFNLLLLRLQFDPEAYIPSRWDGRASVSRVPASGGLGVTGWGYRGQAALPWYWNSTDQGPHLWWVH